jgi:hypothetical protein
MLDEQSWSVGHMRPHMPQLFLWLVTSTQAVPHCVRPAAQPLALQLPFEHTCVPVHMRPQTPQFMASDATHVPPHSMNPVGHAQVPLLHV